MSVPLEDYGLIGDTQTVALASRGGSIDWLCAPRVDSSACLAALLGTPRHGRWSVAPIAPVRAVRRLYRGASLVLDTELTTREGWVRIVECMPVRDRPPTVVRLVEGLAGRVTMRMELSAGFDYGARAGVARRVDGAVRLSDGTESLTVWSGAVPDGTASLHAEFTVEAGECRTAVDALAFSPRGARAPGATGGRDHRTHRALVGGVGLPGRQDDAARVIERVLALQNDLGLLSEQYYVGRRCLVGNFPQTFSHAGLINAACRLMDAGRSRGRAAPVGPAA